MAPKRVPPRHSAFFDLEVNPERDRITRPQSMLRSTEWGGLTLLSLLAGLAFPPYFVSVMALACLNAGGMLWVTHLNEAGRLRLRAFEKDFAQGHALEERGDYRAAAEFYAALAPRYADFPRIAQIALHRVEHLRRTHPRAFAAVHAPKAEKARPQQQAASLAGPKPGDSGGPRRPEKAAASALEALRLGLRRKPA